MRQWQEIVEDGKQKWGDKFSTDGLDPRFAEFYEKGNYIKVREFGEKDEEIIGGWVGITTGWKPSWLLMRTKNAYGSPHLLSKKTIIVKVNPVK